MDFYLSVTVSSLQRQQVERRLPPHGSNCCECFCYHTESPVYHFRSVCVAPCCWDACDGWRVFLWFQAIQNPSDHSLQEKAWNSVCPLVIKLKRFYSFSLKLGAEQTPPFCYWTGYVKVKFLITFKIVCVCVYREGFAEFVGVPDVSAPHAHSAPGEGAGAGQTVRWDPPLHSALWWAQGLWKHSS